MCRTIVYGQVGRTAPVGSGPGVFLREMIDIFDFC
jgi:hypothetical protein